MKLTAKLLAQNAVHLRYEVDFDLSSEDMAKLSEALKVVEDYKSKAMKKVNLKEKNADLTSYRFTMTKDGARLVIDQGAVG